MKFYNPFKPHVVQDGFGTYYVRKLWFYFFWPSWTYMSWSGLFYLDIYVDPEPFFSAEAAESTIRAIRSRRDEEKRTEKKRNAITFVKMVPGRDEA